MSVYLSVIIPTFNRKERLEECLKRLKRQTLNADAFEVIVVNDGSEDETKDFLKSEAESWGKLKVINQKNTGQGIARNNGIKHASGQIILFIGDDIYAEEDFLEKHVNFHMSYPEINRACVGLTHWYEPNKATDFMNWLTQSGTQFKYEGLEPNQKLSFWYFYTSNVSLKRDLLEKECFDPSFKGYGWEDIELAYRLTKHHDLVINFNEMAVAYHDDPIDIERFKKRMRSVGKSSLIFEKMHPELKVAPHGIKKLFFILISNRLAIALLWLVSTVLRPMRKYYWYALSKRYFLQGMKHV